MGFVEPVDHAIVIHPSGIAANKSSVPVFTAGRSRADCGLCRLSGGLYKTGRTAALAPNRRGLLQ